MDAFADRIAGADVCVVQLEIPLETALHALAVARNEGVRTILNPAPAPREPIALRGRLPDAERDRGPGRARVGGTLVLTLGERGAQLGDRIVPAFPASVVDTTGAGDAFTAAFAVGLAEGLSDLEAVRWGCAAGAHMVEHPGVVPGLPTRAQLEEKLESVDGVSVRLIVDTDTAGDDVTSLLIALLHPNAQLEAITICNGNVRFDQQIENALYTVEQAGKSVPVYPGCPKPLVADWIDAAYVHGEDGMGDSFFPKATLRPEPEHAVDELVRRINESPGGLTLLAQAPLTNIATAVVRDPSIAQKVERLYVMGGGIGNITPAAEFNFYVDPEAAKIVFQAGFPITLFTWTLTLSHGVFFDADLARIEAVDTPLARFYRQVTRKAEEFERSMGVPGTTHPDSMVAAAIVEPSLVKATREVFVDVETRGELTRGFSAIDVQNTLGREPNCTLVEDFDTAGLPRALPGRAALSALPPTQSLRERVDTAQVLTRFHYLARAVALACGGWIAAHAAARGEGGARRAPPGSTRSPATRSASGSSSSAIRPASSRREATPRSSVRTRP